MVWSSAVASGVLEGEYAEEVAARPGQGDQPVLDPDRARLARDLPQHLFLVGRGLHGIGVGPIWTSPGPQVAEPVLDERRQPGELVQRLGDGVLAAVPSSDTGEGVVHGLLEVQLGAHCVQLPQCGVPFGAEAAQFAGVVVLRRARGRQ